MTAVRALFMRFSPAPSVPIHREPSTDSCITRMRLLLRLAGFEGSFRKTLTRFVWGSKRFSPPPSVPIQRKPSLSSSTDQIVFPESDAGLRGSRLKTVNG